jgi:phytol kinase
MMNEFFWFAVSFGMVMSVLGVASLLYRLKTVSAQTSRKLIHIGVAHWIFFVPLFESLWVAMMAPIAFVFLNALSQRFQIVKSMEREDKGDYGTVYYAIVLSIITYVSFTTQVFTPAFVAMMILGWGDGLATLVGLRLSSPRLRPGKSLAGSVTVAVVALVVGLLYLDHPWLMVQLIIVAVAAELFAPKGFDNVTIALLPFLLVWLYV